MIGSTINCEKLEQDKPGDEGFFARCFLLQKTSEHEIYVYAPLHPVLLILKSDSPGLLWPIVQ